MNEKFSNAPKINNEQAEGLVKRYVHQTLTIEHFGLHAKIQPNGKVVITGLVNAEGEYDEVEIPASFVFKLANSLKLTRTVSYVRLEDAKDLQPVE